MPMYLFGCDSDKCQAEYETVLSVRTKPEDYPHCPECGGGMHRLIAGVTAVSLKGTGWANDGYACTDMGAYSDSAAGDRNGKIVSFAGQKNKGRA